jgi:hypothetical protein
MSHGEGAGRPPHEPTEETRKLVKDMKAYGIINQSIAEKLGIHIQTLEKHYHYELATGKTDVINMVAGKLITKIMNDDLGAMIFYLKTQGRWRDTSKDDDDDKVNSFIEKVQSKLTAKE